jgi:hypothetical protein
VHLLGAVRLLGRCQIGAANESDLSRFRPTTRASQPC